MLAACQTALSLDHNIIWAKGVRTALLHCAGHQIVGFSGEPAMECDFEFGWRIAKETRIKFKFFFQVLGRCSSQNSF